MQITLPAKNGDGDRYEGYPLAQSMLRYQKTRTASLEEEGKHQIQYHKSNDGWIRSIFIIRGRALDSMVLPWVVAVLHATVYTAVQEVVYDSPKRDSGSWEIVFRCAARCHGEFPYFA
jgi:hypothetical protein